MRRLTRLDRGIEFSKDKGNCRVNTAPAPRVTMIFVFVLSAFLG